MGVNTQKGWYVVFDFFPQYKKIFKHININKLSVVNPNEEGKEYDHMSSTTRKVVDGRLYYQ